MPGDSRLWYLDKVQWALKHRWKTLAAVTTVMIGTFMLATRCPPDSRRPSDFGFINLNIELPPGSRLEDTAGHRRPGPPTPRRTRRSSMYLRGGQPRAARAWSSR